MACECEVVVRRAAPADWEARAALVWAGLAAHHYDAFIFFFFQEVTLQACVLGGAVLFIFCGASVAACAALLPLGGALLLAAVLLAHAAAAERHAQRLREEIAGWVAEYRGPLLADGPPRGARVLLREAEGEGEAGGLLVGTLSVAECWGPRRSGWLQAAGVARAWRRRGVARALLAAARRHAAREGLESLETAVSRVQLPARALLHATGWQLRGTYERPLLGAALALPMARLGLELPHA